MRSLRAAAIMTVALAVIASVAAFRACGTDDDPQLNRSAAMDRLQIERLGGYAGFGQPGSRLRSRGELKVADLSTQDQQAVDRLFAHPPAGAAAHPDGFRYRITRQTPQGPQSVEVPETQVPQALQAVVQDELI